MGVHKKEVTNILSFRNYTKKQNNKNRIDIFSNLDFFKTDRIIIKHNEIEKRIIFKIPSISYVGKTHIVKQDHNMSIIKMTPPELIIGDFPIDQEESNEDQIVIYY